MNNAFLDTTILTDLLLKGKAKNKFIKERLNIYSTVKVPCYAIKEFVHGPLQRYIWFYNKLSISLTLSGAIDALNRESRTPRKYIVSTALEALKEIVSRNKTIDLPTLEAKYGNKVNLETFLRDRYKDSLDYLIRKAWEKRRTVIQNVIQELECFVEGLIVKENSCLKLNCECKKENSCAAIALIKTKLNEAILLRNKIMKEENTPENIRKRQALREVIKGKELLNRNKTCRSLGDSYFLVCCPKEDTIVTTNEKDFLQYVYSLGKKIDIIKYTS